jgi:tetratricopeptide (TPR) repeat protein
VHAVIPAAPTRRAAVLGGAALLWQSAQLVDWAARRAWAIEETKASLDAMVGEDAVLLGAFAPVLVQDSRRVGIPLFGHAAPGELDRYGVTHVVFGSEEDAAALARVEPEAARRLTLVREWPFRSRHARVLQLYRLRGAAYRPTELEIAAAALRDDEPDAALAALERYRAAGGRPVPDVPSMEAHAHFLAGRLGPARAALERAVAMRPTNPEDWFNLGMLRYRAGDADGARRAWRRSLALDPWDERPVRELRRIGG